MEMTITTGAAGSVERWEPAPGEPGRWRRLHSTRYDEPITAGELIERVTAIIRNAGTADDS